MKQQTFIALELFHILYINNIYYLETYHSWVSGKNDSTTCNLIEQKEVLLFSSIALSGMTGEKANTNKTLPVLEQIKVWCSFSPQPPSKYYNTKVCALRFLPDCMVSTLVEPKKQK